MSDREPQYDLSTLDYMVKLNAKVVQLNRRRLQRLFVSVTVDILLTCGVGYGGYQLHEVTVRSQYATCLSGNRARADNRHLWDYVISLNKTAPTSRPIVEFEHYLNAATAPRHCAE